MSVGRNAPCPCGSGKRYKECHGALGGEPGTAAQASADAGVAAVLAQALAAQQQGRLADARRGYEQALAREPANFDALHMLGIVHLQARELELAETMVTRALAVRDEPSARYNLEIVRQARAIQTREQALCRSVLPRLVGLLLEREGADRRLRSQPATVHLLSCERALPAGIVQRLARIVHPSSRVLLWHAPAADVSSSPSVSVESGQFAGERAANEVVIAIGTDHPLDDWTLRQPAGLRVLVITRDATCDLLDRVRELSGQGRTRVLACFAERALRDAGALPGPYIDELAAGSISA